MPPSDFVGLGVGGFRGRDVADPEVRGSCTSSSSDYCSGWAAGQAFLYDASEVNSGSILLVLVNVDESS